MKSWPGKFALACATSLLPFAAHADPKPAIVLPDARDAATWQKWTAELGWQLIAPAIDAHADADARAAALADAVHDAIKAGTADPARIYLAGRGDDSSLVFYIVSREPDLWAAGLALGGSPKPALGSRLIFAANFANTPVFWVSGAAGDSDLAARLKSAGMNIEWRDSKTISLAQCFDELFRRTRAEFPPTADCETNTSKFARCYWMEPVTFDSGERNDVLAPTLVRDGSGAALDLGGFGYKLSDPGPGALISYLPKGYFGPLKIGDRVVELDGQAVADAHDFDDRLNKITVEKQVVATIARGKDRIRLETRTVLPRSDSFVTARVRGEYNADSKALRIVSRSIKEMRVTLPPEWAPADLYWDDLEIRHLEKPGCYLLSIDQELLNAAPCSN